MEPVQPAPLSSAPRKWLRRIGWTLLWIVTILFLAVSLLGAYTKYRYKTAVSEVRAAGIPTSWDEILPKPVPDADNFGALNDFKPFLAVEETKCPPSTENPLGFKAHYLDEKGMEPLKSIKTLKISGGSLQSLGPFEARSLADLRNTAIADKRLAPDTASLSDSEAILKVFEDRNPLWKRLHAAKQRQYAILFLKVPSPKPLIMGNPILSTLLNIANVTQLRARAHTNAGRGADALEECLLLLKLAELRVYPSLIEHLVTLTNMGLLMPVVYEGISRRVWSDAELTVLEKALARYDLLSELKGSLAGESIFAQAWTKLIQSEPMSGKTELAVFLGLNDVGLNDGRAWSAPKWSVAFFANSMIQVIASNNLEHLLYYAKLLSKEPTHDLRTLSDPPEPKWRPFRTPRRSITLAVTRVVKDTVRRQTLVNIARIAIALERHRLRHGSYPSTLEELAHGFLPLITTEVFDGAPLHYRLKDNAQGFTLYSTGWKGTDDGGTMDYSKPDETNWVWSTP